MVPASVIAIALPALLANHAAPEHPAQDVAALLVHPDFHPDPELGAPALPEAVAAEEDLAMAEEVTSEVGDLLSGTVGNLAAVIAPMPATPAPPAPPTPVHAPPALPANPAAPDGSVAAAMG